MCVCSPKTLVQVEELPKFNGKRITSIYAVYENSRYATKEEGGGYIADILYFNCHVHDWDCGVRFGKNKGKSILKVKILPKEFKGLFGMVENKGVKVFVTSLWFRMRDSANGSFTDQTLSMDGWASNSTVGSFSLYRGIDFVNTKEHTYAISEGSKLAKKWDKIFKKSFKVKEVEFSECGAKMEEGSLDFATKYPYEHTPIRFIDGMVYPDEKLSSWRWLHGMPYRVPSSAFEKIDMFGRPDLKYLRVWDDDLKIHLYLEKTEKVELGEEGLVFVTFKHKQHDIYGNEGNAYCRIDRFNESCGFQFARHTITKIDTKKNQVEYDTYRGLERIKRNGVASHNSFYRITKLVNSQEKFTNEDNE